MNLRESEDCMDGRDRDCSDSLRGSQVTDTARLLDRQIRVFISSTFRDMQGERDELIKFVFPQLRKLCAERGVTFIEIDLRWGITEAQAHRGEVLPICLAEIERCQPYFIGLLGERYGWVPTEISEDLIEEQPWLKEHREHSVTALEILHGVQNNPVMKNRAYFYFRDPQYVRSLAEHERAAFHEVASQEEIEKFGAKEAEKRAAERREKLELLKGLIRNSDLPVRENYANPKELARLVLEDFRDLIEKEYPPESKPNELDRERAFHEAFARTRTGVYIGRDEYFDRLNEHARGQGPPLVVLGRSGSGKSALLANWVRKHREDNPGEFVVLHFIGASADSTNWSATLRRILGELKRHYGLEMDVPQQSNEIRAAFSGWLQEAGKRGRTVLVIDGLNQLEDHEGAPDLVWMPEEVPQNVRVVLSTLPGRPLIELESRGWPSMTVEPLQTDERRDLIRDYLKRHGKALSADRLERIAESSKAESPLFLRALLSEICVIGQHECLDEQIGGYLESETIDDLYERILARYEIDYERDRPQLV